MGNLRFISQTERTLPYELNKTFFLQKTLKLLFIQSHNIQGGGVYVLLACQIHFVVLPSFPIKIWGKSVQEFLSYDRKNKQTSRDYNFIYVNTHHVITFGNSASLPYLSLVRIILTKDVLKWKGGGTLTLSWMGYFGEI